MYALNNSNSKTLSVGDRSLLSLDTSHNHNLGGGEGIATPHITGLNDITTIHSKTSINSPPSYNMSLLRKLNDDDNSSSVNEKSCDNSPGTPGPSVSARYDLDNQRLNRKPSFSARPGSMSPDGPIPLTSKTDTSGTPYKKYLADLHIGDKNDITNAKNASKKGPNIPLLDTRTLSQTNKLMPMLKMMDTQENDVKGIHMYLYSYFYTLSSQYLPIIHKIPF